MLHIIDMNNQRTNYGYEGTADTFIRLTFSSSRAASPTSWAAGRRLPSCRRATTKGDIQIINSAVVSLLVASRAAQAREGTGLVP